MKRLVIRNLTLTCDADVNPGHALEQAYEAIRQVNLVLQHDPYPLSARIDDNIDLDNNVDMEVLDEEDTSERFCESCGQAFAIHNDDGSCVKD